jgi:hypothetical protein
MFFISGLVVFFACNGKSSPIGPSTTYQLTVIADAGGTITIPSSSPVSVASGAETAIKAHANAGFSFARWVVNGDFATIAYLNSASTTVKLGTGNDTVRAEFIAVPALPNQINISAFQNENGANFSYYKGTWTTLPDFSSLVPDSSGPCDSMDVNAMPHISNNFGFTYNGYFSITIDGDYTFFLKSADGSQLLLNNSVVITNDGIHSQPVEDSAVVSLSQGTYLMEVRYFDASSSPYLNVSYACVANGIEKQTISNQSLQRPYTGPVPKITITSPAGGETYHLGDTIHVRWTYKNARAQVFASISVDSGKSIENISATAFPPTVTTYDWKIPSDSVSYITHSAFIKVGEYPPYNLFGFSNSFSIIAALVKKGK